MSETNNRIPPPYRNTPYNNPIWVMFIDEESGKPYFFSTETGDTSWDDPMPPTGATEYLKVEREIRDAAENFPDDAEELADDIERNFYLKNAVESELNRGTPPYLSQTWSTRPARIQTERDNHKYAYKEGSENYNIWYHKYTSDRFDRTIREAAQSICDPWKDSGWTEADKRSAHHSAFCIWFAKGCCNRGSSCKFKHHVPNRSDDAENDQMVDIFGRERHAAHKDDMGGVGSFTKECRALYISEIQLDRSQPDCVHKLEAQIWKLFHPWGPIESVRVIPNKSIAFVKYEYRAAAEFAKVACADQPCGLAQAINVRWAFEDPNPKAVEQAKIDARDTFFALIQKRIGQMTIDERINAGLIRVPDANEGALEERFETTIDPSID